MPEEKAADGDIVEQVARAIENETDATWGLDRAARFAIAAVHAADRKAGKVLVDRSDVESLRLSTSLRPDDCNRGVCSEHNSAVIGLRAALGEM